MSPIARKAPPGTRSATRSTAYASGSLIDPSVYARLATNKDKKPIKVRVKAKAVAGGGNSTAVADTSSSQSQRNRSKNAKPSATPTATDSAAAGGAAPPAKKQKLDKSGLVNSMDGRVLAAFPVGRPFEPGSDMVQCKHCKKPVFRPAAPDHILDCLKKKQEKAQKKREAREAKEAALRKEANGGVSPDPRPFPKKSSVGGTGVQAELESGGKKRGKKRKNTDEDGDGSAPKRKRKRDQEKKGRQKGPVDVEKQCGVPMPNGQLCARSLTCKTHSMGLKRSVLGRSQKYDILLAQYQRKNHARQHRAAMEANAPVDDMEDPADIDSEEERDIVMNSINGYYKEDLFSGTRTMGAPLATWDPAPLARRYNYIRLKGVLKSAIDSVHGSRLFTISAFGGGLFSGGSGVGPEELGIDGDIEMEPEVESTTDGEQEMLPPPAPSTGGNAA